MCSPKTTDAQSYCYYSYGMPLGLMLFFIFPFYKCLSEQMHLKFNQYSRLLRKCLEETLAQHENETRLFLSIQYSDFWENFASGLLSLCRGCKQGVSLAPCLQPNCLGRPEAVLSKPLVTQYCRSICKANDSHRYS